MMMRYSKFVPRLYNLCLSFGFTPGKIMPSRAFCSDESQGYPTMLLAQHFGTFPFNHGRVGGVVAAGRHSAHAHHGKDLLIIQASHVGFDPDTGKFGTYRRYQTEGEHHSTNCGKIMGTLEWYSSELKLAQENIFLELENGCYYVVIDNELKRRDEHEGLILRVDRLVKQGEEPERAYSTALRFKASDDFIELVGKDAWKEGERIALGDHLVPELFTFQRKITDDIEGMANLERNLKNAMPWILTSEHPPLTAAKVNTQIEFDRAYRTIIREPSYHGKNLIFLSGIHIDVSPRQGQVFPLTKFIPWACFHQTSDGEHRLYEQAEIMQLIEQQSEDNPHRVDLEAAIVAMQDEVEVVIDVS